MSDLTAEQRAQTMCYVGLKACGCCVAATVDQPRFAKDNAKFIAEMIKDGLTVERRTVEWCRKNLLVCSHEPQREPDLFP